MPESSAVKMLLDTMVAIGADLRALSPRDRALVLRDLACAAVDELRAEGRNSAQIVSQLRLLAMDAGILPNNTDVMDEIESWCVQRYYGPGSRERPPETRT
jgi:hypothetical protein